MIHSSRRLSTRVETWVEAALNTHALKDKDHIVWETQFILTQQGPQMGLMMFMPSGIIGQLATSLIVIQNPAQVTEVEIEDIVKQSLEALRKGRSEVLAEANGDT